MNATLIGILFAGVMFCLVMLQAYIHDLQARVTALEAQVEALSASDQGIEG